jgi:acyl carrier protein
MELTMNDVRGRLTSCFATVFPDLDARDIPRASTDTVDGWDSLASATLTAVVEEEFQIQIDAEHLEDLQSFDALFAYVTDFSSL